MADWTVWTLPARVLAYVLAVEIGALVTGAVGVSQWSAVSGTDLRRLAVLAAGAVGYAEAARRVERLRLRYTAELHVEVDAVWIFAGALLLPLGCSTMLVAVTYLHAGARVPGIEAYKRLFNAATVVPACATAAGVMALTRPAGTAALGGGFGGLAAVLAAMTAYFVVNSLLVGGVVALAAPQPTLRGVFGNWTDNGLDVATLCLGVVTAHALANRPWLVVFVPPALYMLHRNVYISELEEAVRTDPKTGLLNAVAWTKVATRELERTVRQGGTLGVLMVDLDHFKRVNDTHGHLVGDDVLRLLASTLESEVREDDLVGRFGGEEFVVLLPGLAEAEIAQVAERIRRRVTTLTVPAQDHTVVGGLSVSIGAAVYPANGSDLTELLSDADVALYAAKNGGRNQVRVSPVGSGEPRQPI